MRIPIRKQLALLLIASSTLGLSVLAIATWLTNHDFVLSVAASRLRTTAVLKSAQIAYNLELMQTAATFLTTRTIIQQALERYNNGSNTAPDNWLLASSDLRATLGNVGPLTSPLILQTQIFSRNTSGPAGATSVLNETGPIAQIRLPWSDEQGNPVYLGDAGSGYPPSLYPNLTMSNDSAASSTASFNVTISGQATTNSVSSYTISDDPTTGSTATYQGGTLGLRSTLILGPLSVNATFSLLSFTLPIVSNANNTNVIGWATVVGNARLIQLVQQDLRGLGTTGETLLLGPTDPTNNFPEGIIGIPDAARDASVQYMLPLNTTSKDRHPNHILGTENPPFPASAYPAVERAVLENNRGMDDVKSMLRTHNEANKSVSVGYSIVPTDLVDWIVVVEQARSEVWAPIYRLRRIILATLFAVVGFWTLLSYPIAHWAVLPIVRLRAATAQTIDPPRSHPSPASSDASSHHFTKVDTKSVDSRSANGKRKGFVETIARWRGKRNGSIHIEPRDDQRFRIPGKVSGKNKGRVQDEMTDLITTFNDMSDELYLQYSQLDERVRQRTIELEHSKKAAEAANESKTLFVANVSHELRTPLNGILGMCAVCMEESDLNKLKQSLGIIYKSGDLLLRTLTDLLTFSTNQVGHQVLKLDEREFYLRDLESQITALFGDQAREKGIALKVVFEDMPLERFSSPDQQPSLKDIALWGDIHRIMQMVINFTSNALKFTPADGFVTVTVRALSETPVRHRSNAGSTIRYSHGRIKDQAQPSPSADGTANFINPREIWHEQVDPVPCAPPGDDIYIEFDVRDTGPGIPEEQQRSIFEPFVQASAGLSRKHSGTGLGLSICLQLASLMRGTIGLTSTVGRGSTFTTKLPLRRIVGTASGRNSLTMKNSDRMPIMGERPTERVPTIAAMTARSPVSPVAAAPPDTAVPPPLTSTPSSQARAIGKAGKDIKAGKEAQQDFSNVRILVAEDNKVNQEVILRMLKLEKIFDVTIAHDGQAALDLIKASTLSGEASQDSDEQASSSNSAEDSVSSSSATSTRPHPYDLVFMDIQMPRMDGLTSTRLIRQHGYTGPIVALTAYAEQSNVEGCYQAGMDYFLAKPIKRPLLRKVLTDCCSSSSTTSGSTPKDASDDDAKKVLETDTTAKTTTATNGDGDKADGIQQTAEGIEMKTLAKDPQQQPNQSPKISPSSSEPTQEK